MLRRKMKQVKEEKLLGGKGMSLYRVLREIVTEKLRCLSKDLKEVREGATAICRARVLQTQEATSAS